MLHPTGHLNEPSITATHTASHLWRLSPQEFNTWRIQYDFPRIIAFFHAQLNGFTEWQHTMNLTDSDMATMGLAYFLRPEPSLTICIAISAQGYQVKSCSYAATTKPDNQYKLLGNRCITPFLTWARRKRIRVHPQVVNYQLTITPATTTKCALLLNEFPLLQLGRTVLTGATKVGARNLTFACLDALVVQGAKWDTPTFIWYSSAVNMKVKSPVSYISAFNCNLTGLEVSSTQAAHWHVDECAVTVTTNQARLVQWEICSPDTFLLQCQAHELVDCHFLMRARTPAQVCTGVQLYSCAKYTYQAQNRKPEAGRYYYLLRCLRRRQLAAPLYYYSHLFPSCSPSPNTWRLLWQKWRCKVISTSVALAEVRSLIQQRFGVLVNPLSLTRYMQFRIRHMVSLLNWLWWGYGERPFRVMGMSALTIGVAAACYYLWGYGLETKGNVVNSLYLSVVTFTTLGYGDITPTDGLRLVAAAEALIGALSTGMLIAGYTNRSRY